MCLNVYDPCSCLMLQYLSSSKKGLNGDLNPDPDLCNACAVLYQLSHHVIWKLVIMWVNDEPIDDGYRPFYA